MKENTGNKTDEENAEEIDSSYYGRHRVDRIFEKEKLCLKGKIISERTDKEDCVESKNEFETIKADDIDCLIDILKTAKIIISYLPLMSTEVEERITTLKELDRSIKMVELHYDKKKFLNLINTTLEPRKVQIKSSLIDSLLKISGPVKDILNGYINNVTGCLEAIKGVETNRGGDYNVDGNVKNKKVL